MALVSVAGGPTDGDEPTQRQLRGADQRLYRAEARLDDQGSQPETGNGADIGVADATDVGTADAAAIATADAGETPTPSNDPGIGPLSRGVFDSPDAVREEIAAMGLDPDATTGGSDSPTDGGSAADGGDGDRNRSTVRGYSSPDGVVSAVRSGDLAPREAVAILRDGVGSAWNRRDAQRAAREISRISRSRASASGADSGADGGASGGGSGRQRRRGGGGGGAGTGSQRGRQPGPRGGRGATPFGGDGQQGDTRGRHGRTDTGGGSGLSIAGIPATTAAIGVGVVGVAYLAAKRLGWL